ncbi:unnamed protein product [Didymodactylos carnosus]|uniref:Uncharacterized protein n=1 Tax=Didymodactylos carnosus TaxID=1234261 RepID=A0A814D440_9BILA|nr:unnamed protein product [Didymodactylos carnosus]CAF3726485.1 unnamed protein product [Didymodactylos carnosus]
MLAVPDIRTYPIMPSKQKKSKSIEDDIKLSQDGTRRRIFNVNRWRLLCRYENCLTPAKQFCRRHKDKQSEKNINNGENIVVATENGSNNDNIPGQWKRGDLTILSNSRRHIFDGKQFRQLCKMDNCMIQAREYCRRHVHFARKISDISPDEDKSDKMTVNNEIIKTNYVEEQEQQLIPQRGDVKTIKSGRRVRFSDSSETISSTQMIQQEIQLQIDSDILKEKYIEQSVQTDLFCPFLETKIEETDNMTFTLSTTTSRTTQEQSQQHFCNEMNQVIIKQDMENESLIVPGNLPSVPQTLQDVLRQFETEKNNFNFECERISDSLRNLYDYIEN